MDEAAVWDRELAQQEVLDIFSQGYVLAPVPEPGSLAILAVGILIVSAERLRRKV